MSLMAGALKAREAFLIDWRSFSTEMKREGMVIQPLKILFGPQSPLPLSFIILNLKDKGIQMSFLEYNAFNTFKLKSIKNVIELHSLFMSKRFEFSKARIMLDVSSQSFQDFVGKMQIEIADLFFAYLIKKILLYI